MISNQSRFAELIAQAASLTPNQIFDAGSEHVFASVAAEANVDFRGLQLNCPASVYTPGPTSSTEFVTRNWANAELVSPGGTLLELGCGCGALSLLAARDGWNVMGVDINAQAIESAKANARVNRIDAEFIQSDLFSACSGRMFDVILFNLPFMHMSSGKQDIALVDESGNLATRFFDEAAAYLRPEGKLVFSWANCSDSRVLAREDWSLRLVGCDYESVGQYWRALITARRP